jgi:pyruvate/2-oxoglutarate dehydrogenase complex dihydrolipoamide acyltransferase (E2) component
MPHDLRLPKINPNMSTAIVECVYATPGAILKPGDKLFDLSVDLSSSFSQYCPPISYFRVVMREKLWLRETLVAPGDEVDIGALLALFSAEEGEPLEISPSRAVRVTTAGIAHHSGLWSANNK